MGTWVLRFPEGWCNIGILGCLAFAICDILLRVVSNCCNCVWINLVFACNYLTLVLVFSLKVVLLACDLSVWFCGNGFTRLIFCWMFWAFGLSLRCTFDCGLFGGLRWRYFRPLSGVTGVASWVCFGIVVCWIVGLVFDFLVAVNRQLVFDGFVVFGFGFWVVLVIWLVIGLVN